MMMTVPAALLAGAEYVEERPGARPGGAFAVSTIGRFQPVREAGLEFVRIATIAGPRTTMMES